MAGAGGSIALTTYQAGKVVMIGWDGARVTLLPRHFERPMGLDVRGGRLLLATRRHLHVLADSPDLARDFPEGRRRGGMTRSTCPGWPIRPGN